MNFKKMFGHLFNKQDELPTSADSIGEYKRNFDKAIQFTRKCGLEVGALKWTDGDVLDKEGNFIWPALKAAGVTDITKSAAQCLKWCHYIAPEFEKQLGYKVMPTIGQLWFNGKPVFNPTWEELQQWSDRGIQPVDLQNRIGMNLHAWLTVQSGEIIDPTLLNTLAKFGGDSYAQFLGSVAFGNPDRMNHRYFPMAAGREYFEAIGNNSFVPLLAKSPKELHEYRAMIVAG